MAKQKNPSSIDYVNPSQTHISAVVVIILLICLPFGLILAFAENLETSLKWVLSIFLIMFSVIGLVISIGLLSRQTKKILIAKHNEEIDWKISQPDKQKKKLNLEVKEIASILKIPNEQMSDLLSAYIVAEDLALRQIQYDSNKIMMRYVNVGNIPFDAVLIDQNIITCIEMTFSVTPEIAQTKIDKILNKIELARKTAAKLHKDTKFKLLFVAVTQLDPEGEATLRATIIDKFKTTTTDVDIRLLDFAKLQKTYALE